jgi:hypothetical protein
MSLALSPRLVGAGRAVEAAAVGIAAVTVGAVVTVCWLGELVVFTVVLPPAGWPTVCWVSGPPAPPPGATVQVMTPLLPEPTDGTKPAGQLVVTVVVVLPADGVVVTLLLLGVVTVVATVGDGIEVTCAEM